MMKKIWISMQISRWLIALAIGFPFFVQAQDHWPAAYRVDRWLDRMPAGNTHQLDGMMAEFFAYGQENMDALLLHLDHATAVATPLDYAVTSLFRYVSQAGHEVERSLFINGLVSHWNAIEASPVRKYLLQEMQFMDDQRLATPILAGLKEKELRSDAIAAMKDYTNRNLLKSIKKGLKSGDSEIWSWIANHQQDRWQMLLWKQFHRAQVEDQAFFLKSIALRGNPQDSTAMAGLAASHPDAVLTYLERIKGDRFPVQTAKALLGTSNGLSQQSCSVMHLLFKAKPLFAFQLHPQSFTSGPCASALITDLIQHPSKALDAEIQKQMAVDSNDIEAQKKWLTVLSERGGFSNEQFLRQWAGTPNEALATDALLAWAKLAGAESMPYLTDWYFKSKDSVKQEQAWPLIRQFTDGGNMKSLADRISSLTPAFRMKLLELIGERKASFCFAQVYYQTQQNDSAVANLAWKTLAQIAEPQHDGLLRTLIKEAPGKMRAGVAEGLLNPLHADSDQSKNWAWIDTTLEKEMVLPLLIKYGAAPYAQQVIGYLEQTPGLTSNLLIEQLLARMDEESFQVLLWIASHHETMRTMVVEKAVPQTKQRIKGMESQRLWLVDWLQICRSQHERDVVFQQFSGYPSWNTFLTLRNYANGDNLHSLAFIRTLSKICLPTDGRSGLVGPQVKETLEKILPTVEMFDNQEALAIETYLEQMPGDGPYQVLFNGVDLTGWQGWVADPHTLLKLTREERQSRQKEADQKMQQHWRVKDGMIVFSGEGANLVTKRQYKDFELQLDWKITKDGDSGIYLRGYPQVQIWDTSRVDVGAQVGSGGLYNNLKGFSTPLQVADRPVGSWNHFKITLSGDKVTVFLNDRLVVNEVALENYWDRKLPILSEGPIELQAHGTDLAFRNIIVREILPGTFGLTQEEINQGYTPLFNGINLDNWLGNTTDYQVKDDVIDVDPSRGGEGNLYTVDTFSNFSLRFEFQLTPGANNGIGIHAPLTGDAAYEGKEIQVLENTAAIYQDLQPYQYHGSVYGVIPARQGYLKAVGQWNEEEIWVEGDHIRVTLNGEVITEGSLNQWTLHGTMDHKEHPGLRQHSGHIGFLGHGSPLKFRNVRILRL